jgi:hypothetical protein
MLLAATLTPDRIARQTQTKKFLDAAEGSRSDAADLWDRLIVSGKGLYVAGYSFN